MIKKVLHVLLLVFIIICLVSGGVWFGVLFYQKELYENPLFLQEKYASTLEDKLVHLLEPAVGIGNIRASVQAEITEQSMNQTQTKPPYLKTRETKEYGPLLVNQSVSVLINEKDSSKLPIYERLIRSAIGYTPERGDMLSVEGLPFIKESIWLLGLSPILLMRIALGLLFLIILGVFWLIHAWLSYSPKKSPSFVRLNKAVWQRLQELPAASLADVLKVKRPEVTATVLYRLSQEKASTIIELLPADYMNNVILHLNHIEHLSPIDRNELFLLVEKELSEIIQAVQSSKNTSSSSAFEIFTNWSDTDLQNLLHYISKKDLIVALQYASLATQQAFARNIPPALWQNIIYQTQLSPCSESMCKQAQERILKMADLLKGKN